MKITAIIPARLESTRLPKKVLADIGGSSMLQRVYQVAVTSLLFEQVIVATDSELVMDHCIKNNMRSMTTSVAHQSGTDRIAEVAEMVDSDIIINMQADEPFLENSNLIALVELMKREEVTIGTLAKKIETTESLLDYNSVKLVKDRNNKVLYFSRQAIPAQRDEPYRNWLKNESYYHHLGLYGFKKETLIQITKLDQSKLELAEKLEQLRWIENGHDVYVSIVKSESFGIDTVEDLERARTYAISKAFTDNLKS